jgi:hypothetical protein
MFVADLSTMMNAGSFDAFSNSNNSNTLNVTPLMLHVANSNANVNATAFTPDDNNNNIGVVVVGNNDETKMVSRASSRNSTASSKASVPKCVDKTKTLLPMDFQPSDYTIICGNKRKYFNSVGNRRLRLMVQNFIPQYSKADGKLEKSYIVTKVMNMIREACPVGAFVAFEGGRWWEVSERTSREKVGTLFRDALAGKYKSSAQNKIAQRKTKRQAKREQKRQELQKQQQLVVEQQQQLTKPEKVNSLATANRQQLWGDDEDSGSVSSGNASFYDVDDLRPVPLYGL